MPLHAGMTDTPVGFAAEHHHYAMAGFFGIMELWGASNAHMQKILGSPPVRTFYQWKSNRVIRVPDDTLRRIGYRGPVALMCYAVPDDTRDHLGRSMKTWKSWQLD